MDRTAALEHIGRNGNVLWSPAPTPEVQRHYREMEADGQIVRNA